MLDVFRKLFCRLYPLEANVINAVKTKLSPTAQEILQIQLNAIRKVARSPGHTELMIWLNNNYQSFPNATLELKLATCKMTVPGFHQYLKAEMWLVRGHIFSIQFNDSVKIIRNKEDVAVTAAELNADPMCPVETVELEPIDPNIIKAIQLEGSFKDWNGKYTTVESKKPPQSEAQTRKAISVFHTLFPPDYIELLKQTDGAFIDNLIVFGSDEIVEVDYDGRKYFAIAVIDGDYIATPGHITENKIFRLPHDSSKPEALGSSFKVAIERCLADSH